MSFVAVLDIVVNGLILVGVWYAGRSYKGWNTIWVWVRWVLLSRSYYRPSWDDGAWSDNNRTSY